MGVAFENACRRLGLMAHDDPTTEIVASKIISLARLGECDPERLCSGALQEINPALRG